METDCKFEKFVKKIITDSFAAINVNDINTNITIDGKKYRFNELIDYIYRNIKPGLIDYAYGNTVKEMEKEHSADYVMEKSGQIEW